MKLLDFDQPNHRILVIDDNRAIHDDLRKIFQGEGLNQTALQEDEELLFGTVPVAALNFELDSAYQGQEGLEMVQAALADSRPYALAFVDVRMPPGWDGVETISHLRLADPRLQTVICTAYSDYSWSDIQRRLGNSDSLLILKKPFDNIEVIQLAHALTTKWLTTRLAEARLADLDRMVAQRTAELKSINAQYRIIAETASDGIMTMDFDGNIRFANRAMGAIFGYPEGELSGRNFSRLVPDFERHLPLPGSPSGLAVELTGRHRTGSPMTLEVSFAESLDGGGDMIWTTVLRDVTERKRLETNRALAKKLESIGRLAAGIAHEINTPIQFTADNLDFIQRSHNSLERVFEVYRRLGTACERQAPTGSLLDEIREVTRATKVDYLWRQTPDAIREAAEGVRRVAEIVRAMHEFAHPGSGDMTPTDLNRLLEATVTVSQNKWKSVADLRLELDPDLPAVAGVAGELSQVFLNLIVNAADAVHDTLMGSQGQKGTIAIASRRAGKYVEVRVSDSGTGIPETARPRIFDLFFTTKDVGRGSGQGLAIAHSIVVQKHHGTIEFETAVGAGTIFIVRLPIEAANGNGNGIAPAHCDGLAAMPV